MQIPRNESQNFDLWASAISWLVVPRLSLTKYLRRSFHKTGDAKDLAILPDADANIPTGVRVRGNGGGACPGGEEG